MELKLGKNPFGYFNNDLSQKANPVYNNCCTLFGPAINLYYNTGVKLTYDDLNKLIDQQHKAGKLNLYTGGPLYDNAEAVAKYTGKTLITFNKKDPIYFKLLNAGYMVQLGFGVNSEFYSDIRPDGDLDLYKDYIKYAGTKIRHTCNVIRWIKQPSEDFGKEFIVDNYFFEAGENLYTINSEEMLKISYDTMYAFI